MNRRSVCAVGLMPFIFGCGTPSKSPQVDLDTFAKTIYLPELGKIITTNIGDPMISTLRVAVLPAIELANDIIVSAAESVDYSILTTLWAGSYVFWFKDASGGTYFKSKRVLPVLWKAVKPKGKDNASVNYRGGIHIGTNGSTSFYFIWEGRDSPTELYASSDIKYVSTTAHIDLPAENLQKELVYAGLSQSTVTLKYREYWRGVSRPDYSQDVRYDISQGRSIGFRESRFEVIEANNTTITYRAAVHLK